MTRLPLPLNPDQLHFTTEWLLEGIRAGELRPETALVVLANALGLGSEIQEAAHQREQSFRLAVFGDAFVAELVIRRTALTDFPKEILAAFRPHRALSSTELEKLLFSRADGSKRRLSQILSCDRATVRRLLRSGTHTRT